mgnify:CR=1 FL=1
MIMMRLVERTGHQKQIELKKGFVNPAKQSLLAAVSSMFNLNSRKPGDQAVMMTVNVDVPDSKTMQSIEVSIPLTDIQAIVNRGIETLMMAQIPLKTFEWSKNGRVAESVEVVTSVAGGEVTMSKVVDVKKAVRELFTEAERRKASKLYTEEPPGCFAERCDKEIVAPVIARINVATGQENCSRYFAYMLELYFMEGLDKS